MKINILLADDNSAVRKLVSIFLTKYGIDNIICCRSGEEFKAACADDTHIAILDIHLPGAQGLELIDYALDKNEDCRCIMVSGTKDITLAIEALNKGAWKYVDKDNPEWLHELARFVQKASEHVKLGLKLERTNSPRRVAMINQLEDAIRYFKMGPEPKL